MKQKFLVVVIALLFSLNCFAQSINDVKTIERFISRSISTAYPSSVLISVVDSLPKQPSSMFSGVVVSEEGHVLTVAHATMPNQRYQLIFPDGQKYFATGLGRIAVKDTAQGRYLDMAMIKIVNPGKIPYAEMANNTEMKVGQPAISISYPGSLFGKKPKVRHGQVMNVDWSKGTFVSSCKMEPGDSGGPLFDGLGRVIGIHSWILKEEDRNFEVPVELYRKYWSALNKPIDYTELPEEDKIIVQDTKNSRIPVVGKIDDLIGLPSAAKNTVVTIASEQGAKFVRILGTVIGYQNAGQHETYILSKSSMVGTEPVVEINRKTLRANVLRRSNDDDLVLLKLSEQVSGGIKLTAKQDSLHLQFSDLGKFLISALDSSAKKVGVLSSNYVELEKRYSIGFFGANARFIDEKITITEIMKGSPAEMLLTKQDHITGINGIPISKPADYGTELMKYSAGDSISVELVRAGEPMQVHMHMPGIPEGNHIAVQFEGRRSSRSDGFKRVFVQDAAVKADECGGPVFDQQGRFYGINIARHSRTSTIVMPVDVILKFLNQPKHS